MCDFISWIEYKEEILYLTSKDLETSAGKRLLREVGAEDIKGHGAIRKFFNLPQGKGTGKECKDFSCPDNFPKDIVRDIKKGLFAGFGIAQNILKNSAWVEYEKIRQSALAEYKKIRQSAWAEYEKIRQSALAEYEKIRQPALAEYEKIQQPAWVEYEKIVGITFWGLVKIKSNRVEKWR